MTNEIVFDQFYSFEQWDFIDNWFIFGNEKFVLQMNTATFQISKIQKNTKMEKMYTFLFSLVVLCFRCSYGKCLKCNWWFFENPYLKLKLKHVMNSIQQQIYNSICYKMFISRINLQKYLNLKYVSIIKETNHDELQ